MGNLFSRDGEFTGETYLENDLVGRLIYIGSIKGDGYFVGSIV